MTHYIGGTAMLFGLVSSGLFAESKIQASSPPR